MTEGQSSEHQTCSQFFSEWFDVFEPAASSCQVWADADESSEYCDACDSECSKPLPLYGVKLCYFCLHCYVEHLDSHLVSFLKKLPSSAAQMFSLHRRLLLKQIEVDQLEAVLKTQQEKVDQKQASLDELENKLVTLGNELEHKQETLDSRLRETENLCASKFETTLSDALGTIKVADLLKKDHLSLQFELESKERDLTKRERDLVEMRKKLIERHEYREKELQHYMQRVQTLERKKRTIIDRSHDSDPLPTGIKDSFSRMQQMHNNPGFIPDTAYVDDDSDE